MIHARTRPRDRRDTVTGAAALGFVALMAAALIALKGLPGVGANAPLQITVTFPSAGGLQEGDDVRASGVVIGHVTALELVRDGAKATLAIELNIGLREDCEFRIADRSVLGGSFVDARPGKGAPTARRDFQGRRPDTIFDAFAEIMKPLFPPPGTQGFLSDLGDAADAVAGRRGVIGELANGTLGGDMRAIRDAFALERESTARLLRDDEELKKAWDEIARAVRTIREGEGAAAYLAQMAAEKDGPAARDASEISTGFAYFRDAIKERRGSTLLLDKDDPLWKRIGELRDTLDVTSDKAEGGFAWFFTTEARIAIRSLRASLADISYLTSRGSVAHIGEGGMGNVLFDVIGFLAGDGSDFREQSPFIPIMRLAPLQVVPGLGLSVW